MNIKQILLAVVKIRNPRNVKRIKTVMLKKKRHYLTPEKRKQRNYNTKQRKVLNLNRKGLILKYPIIVHPNHCFISILDYRSSESPSESESESSQKSSTGKDFEFIDQKEAREAES